jgi:hypothetical protein
MEATLARDPDAREWGMLKGYFAALERTLRRNANRLRPFLMSKFVGALVVGSRGVPGTRTIKKQKRY